nr:hypothetical protein [Tanacetum cinerariifolium]
MPLKPDLILADVDEYVVSEPLIKDWISDSEDENETKSKSKQRKPSFAKVEFVKPNEQVISPREYIKQEEHNRQNSSRAVVSINTARQINTAYPRPTVNSAWPVSNVFNKAHSHDRRPFNKFTANKDNNFSEKVNTVRGNITTGGPKAVVSDDKGNKGNPQLKLPVKGVIDS